MSVTGIVRSHFVHPGAGYTLQFPLDCSTGYVSDPTSQAVKLDDRQLDAYFVAPASHIGRVVTGVVFVAEQSRTIRSIITRAGTYERYGITAISFADKLAEQGYKVLVLDLYQLDSATQEHAAVLHQAALYLKKKQDVQRVGLIGVGAGADLSIKVAMERSAGMDCVIAMCPKGHISWESYENSDELDRADSPVVPILLQIGAKSPYAASKAYKALSSSCAANPLTAATFKTSLFDNQRSGFAFSNITDEDAATQAIAEILDWLVQHLHRFQMAAATSNTDSWWPQGRNGPFFNVGLRAWQESRGNWLRATQTRPPRPPPVPAHLLFDGLSSVRRTFDLPHRMRLGDVIELFAEIWEVQQ
ncbi:hypothetical protein CCR75_004982 [Bremia lactucae]|uniref:Dienelactone hydrolase domain-containing protein n=1 Tax=Bremia lactucae TaxID=4779 RepID=A0A976FPL0_BRELC|nr:hypothetical protein CCR75_004982 [Bremia lactucae]